MATSTGFSPAARTSTTAWPSSATGSWKSPARGVPYSSRNAARTAATLAPKRNRGSRAAPRSGQPGADHGRMRGAHAAAALLGRDEHLADPADVARHVDGGAAVGGHVEQRTR